MPADRIHLTHAKEDKLFYVVANLVVYRESDGRCLLLKRSETEVAHPGKYAVPGGKLEWSQYDIAAPTRINGDVLDYEDALEELLIRETREEAGIEVDPESFQYINSIGFVRPDGIPCMLIKLCAKYKSGAVQIEEGAFTDYIWANAEEATALPIIKGIDTEIAKCVALFSR